MPDSQQIGDLPEYARNPFIQAMRPAFDIADTVNALHHPIEIDPSERSLRPAQRRHCALRLMNWFYPTADHTVFAERIDMLIRQGYLGRNPADGSWTRRLANGANSRELGIDFEDLQPSEASTALSFALLGTPGMGKTQSTKRILSSYQQVVRPQMPGAVKQLTYLEVQCPTGGSLRQLLKNILTAIDRALGQRKYHKAGRAEVDDLLFEVAQALQVHAVGVLVIDEINFLNAAKTDKERVINFLTSLVNVFCVPVLFVGTAEGETVLTGTLRNGRRASGLGSMLFEPWDYDDEWKSFVERLFKYQWLSLPTPFTDELCQVLWEESRGILDVVIKLFVLAQFRVIREGELEGVPEVLSARLFREISKTDLRLVQPMLDALRDGTPGALAKYPDLSGMHRLFEKALLRAGDDERRQVASLIPEPLTPADKLRVALRGFGTPESQIELVVANAMAQVSITDPLAVTDVLPAIIENVQDDVTAQKRVRRRPINPSELAPDDVRRVCDGTASNYEALRAAGMMGVPA